MASEFDKSSTPSSKGEKPDVESASSQDFGVGKTQEVKRLGWKKNTICLIVEAIALGSLSMPSVFASLGMVAGVICTVGIGLIATYASFLVGAVALKHPHIRHYADACALMGERTRLLPGGHRFWWWLTSVMFVLFLTLVTGSHVLTGTIALVDISREMSLCAVVWGVVSAVLLFALALPPSFHSFAFLGYVDFASIMIAILITIIATGVNTHGGATVDPAHVWSAWPKEGLTFASAVLSITNIVFAYSFAVCQYSFMSEMHTPEDYVKSISWLGGIEICVYTLTGALVYAFVGTTVASPALLSAGSLISRIVFGIALPVIFISGSINSNVAGRFMMDEMFSRVPRAGKAWWLLWIVVVVVITVVGFVIAEAVPFFNALLGLISSLFISGFSFYFPAMFWFTLLREPGTKWYSATSLANIGLFVFGVAVLGLGVYASVEDILSSYTAGTVRGAFTCSAASYAS